MVAALVQDPIPWEPWGPSPAVQVARWPGGRTRCRAASSSASHCSGQGAGLRGCGTRRRRPGPGGGWLTLAGLPSPPLSPLHSGQLSPIPGPGLYMREPTGGAPEADIDGETEARGEVIRKLGAELRVGVGSAGGGSGVLVPGRGRKDGRGERPGPGPMWATVRGLWADAQGAHCPGQSAAERGRTRPLAPLRASLPSWPVVPGGNGCTRVCGWGLCRRRREHGLCTPHRAGRPSDGVGQKHGGVRCKDKSWRRRGLGVRGGLHGRAVREARSKEVTSRLDG